jgi:hypothetical protein
MKRIRPLFLAVLFAGLAACTTHRDLKSPCAGCDDAIQPRIEQQA